MSLTKQGIKTCALWGFRWCHRISGDRGEFEFRPPKDTLSSNNIFGDRKGGCTVANDTKYFKSFYNSVVSVTLEMKLKSLKVPRDLWECQRAIWVIFNRVKTNLYTKAIGFILRVKNSNVVFRILSLVPLPNDHFWRDWVSGCNSLESPTFLIWRKIFKSSVDKETTAVTNRIAINTRVGTLIVATIYLQLIQNR